MTDKEILKHISIVEDYYEDIEDNPSLYFCQIYKDADQNEEIDFFTIRKNDLHTDDFAEVEKFAIDYAQQTFSFFREIKDMNNLTTTDLLNNKVLPQNTDEKIKRLLNEPALRISWEDGEFEVQATKGEHFTIHKDGTVTIDDEMQEFDKADMKNKNKGGGTIMGYKEEKTKEPNTVTISYAVETSLLQVVDYALSNSKLDLKEIIIDELWGDKNSFIDSLMDNVLFAEPFLIKYECEDEDYDDVRDELKNKIYDILSKISFSDWENIISISDENYLNRNYDDINAHDDRVRIWTLVDIDMEEFYKSIIYKLTNYEIRDVSVKDISWINGEFKVETTEGEKFTIHKDGTVTIDDKTASHMITDNEISFKYETSYSYQDRIPNPNYYIDSTFIKNCIMEDIFDNFDFITQMTNAIIDKYFVNLAAEETFPAISKVLEDLQENDWDKIIHIHEYHYDNKSDWDVPITVDISNIKQEIMNSIENLDIDGIELD